MESERLGRFGHHPDPAIDFCIEVETLQGELFDIACGLTEGRMSINDLGRRIENAMAFTVGGDQNAIDAKDLLRSLEREYHAFWKDGA
jgi:hypothetical protein